ncbi:MAG: serine/threonine dehydratase [Pseudomonadota bacterium]
MSVTIRDIIAAEALIRRHIRLTPVMEVDPADFGIDWKGRLTLKLEGFQHSGSFKVRGAFTSLLTPPRDDREIVAFSGGNHGAAVGFAARALGQKAVVFVPEYAPKTKLDKIRACGADARVIGATVQETIAAYEAYLAQSGGRDVHPYAAPLTIAGQGTLGLEWASQCPDLDAVLVAIGGGGLISGVAAAMQAGPSVIGIEPTGARCAFEARKAGAPVDFPPRSVAADSLGAPSIAALNYELIDEYVDHLALVEDDAITAAQKALWSICGVVSEPGGAATLAALMSGAITPEPGAHVGVLVCGSNVDPGSVL